MFSSTAPLLLLGSGLLCLVINYTAHAAEKKAYKYIDAQGNVVYSQMPPSDGRVARKVDISPAHSAHGGNKRHEVYLSSVKHSTHDRHQRILDEQKSTSEDETTRRREELRRRQIEQAEEECVRHRGADCKNQILVEDQESRRLPLRRR